MSWSVSIIGTPEAIAAELNRYGAEIANAASKREFNAALPSLLGLLAQNFCDPENPLGYEPIYLRLTAKGNGRVWDRGTEKPEPWPVYGSCFVTLEEAGGKVV